MFSGGHYRPSQDNPHSTLIAPLMVFLNCLWVSIRQHQLSDYILLDLRFVRHPHLVSLTATLKPYTAHYYHEER